MRAKIEVIKCDLCSADMTESRQLNYPVIFLTEQDEGRPTKPYVEHCKLDICDSCRNKVLKIKAHGAQGHNTYELRGDK